MDRTDPPGSDVDGREEDDQRDFDELFGPESAESEITGDCGDDSGGITKGCTGDAEEDAGSKEPCLAPQCVDVAPPGVDVLSHSREASSDVDGGLPDVMEGAGSGQTSTDTDSPDLLASYDTLDDWHTGEDTDHPNIATDTTHKMSSEPNTPTSCVPDLLSSLPEDELDKDGKFDDKSGGSQVKKDEENLKMTEAAMKKETGKERDDFFSAVTVPNTSHLNVDISKHKRALSKRGSIANRKRPSRAILTVKETNDDRLYTDSTEPKLSKHNEETEQSEETQHHEAVEEKEKKPSINKKMMGIPIPGLLQGLHKSGIFSRAEGSHSTQKAVSPKEDLKTDESKSPEFDRNEVKVPSAGTMPKPQPRLFPKPFISRSKDLLNKSIASESKDLKSSDINKEAKSKINTDLLQALNRRQAKIQASTTSTSEIPETKPIFATEDPKPPLHATEDPKPPLHATEDPKPPLHATENPQPPLHATKDPKPPLLATKDPKQPLLAPKDPKPPLFATKDPKPPILATKPSLRTSARPFCPPKPNPPVASKPNVPIVPKKPFGIGAGDGTTKESPFLNKNRVLPSIGDVKLSTGDTTQSTSIRSSASFRQSPTFSKKDLKPSNSFRVQNKPTDSSPPDFLSRLKKTPVDHKISLKNDCDISKTQTDTSSNKVTDSIDSNKEEASLPQKNSVKLQRKSSVSHVESPLEKEKSGGLVRQRSVSGSAYNPIAFTRNVNSVNTDSKDKRTESTSSSSGSPESDKLSATNLSESSSTKSSLFTANTSKLESTETPLPIIDSKSPPEQISDINMKVSENNQALITSSEETREKVGQNIEDTNKAEDSNKPSLCSSETEDFHSRIKEKPPVEESPKSDDKTCSSGTEINSINVVDSSAIAKLRQSPLPKATVTSKDNKDLSDSLPVRTPTKWREHLTTRPAVTSNSEEGEKENRESPYSLTRLRSIKRPNIPEVSSEKKENGSSPNLTAVRSSLKRTPSDRSKSDLNSVKSSEEQNSPLMDYRNKLSSRKCASSGENDKPEVDSNSNKDLENDQPIKRMVELSSKKRLIPEKDSKTETSNTEDKPAPWLNQVTLRKPNIPEKVIDQEPKSETESPHDWKKRLSTRRPNVPEKPASTADSEKDSNEETSNIFKKQMSVKRRSTPIKEITQEKADDIPEFIRKVSSRHQRLSEQGIKDSQ